MESLKQRMNYRDYMFFGFLSLLITSLAAGFLITGIWIGFAGTVILTLGWLGANKYSAAWMMHFCLFVSIALAAAGILTGSPAWLCLAGGGFSLAVWDLLLFNQAMQGNPSSDQSRSYEIKHLQSLGLAVGLGIFAGIFGRLLHLQTPFVLIVIFIALIVFGLNRIWDYFKR